MQTRLIFTVAELNRHIKAALEPLYTDIWVEGELSNVRTPSSGHCYFTLKDAASQLRAVMFRMQGRLLRFVPEDGMKVICRGRITIYEPRGEYQLVVEQLEPKGIGALQLAFEQLKQKLLQEGLFEQTRKKPLPFLPKNIAVITSPTGAAVRDIIHIVHRRFPSVSIIIIPVKVQGPEAPDEIAAALATANSLRCADVIILGRGGGSLEDLWAFNTEKVARAISASHLPVISAVGHEIDFTIADFVADVRAATPSAAAELVVKEKKELAQKIASLQSRIHAGTMRHLRRDAEALQPLRGNLYRSVKKIDGLLLRHDDMQLRLLQTLPQLLRYKKAELNSARRIISSRARLAALTLTGAKIRYLAKTLRGSMQSLTQAKSALFRSSMLRLQALNPAGVLERGFSITRLIPSMKIITRSGDVQPGDTVNITFSNGGIDCLVKRVLQ
jgi:exodeoxyribonuclease VII large subunit